MECYPFPLPLPTAAPSPRPDSSRFLPTPLPSDPSAHPSLCPPPSPSPPISPTLPTPCVNAPSEAHSRPGQCADGRAWCRVFAASGRESRRPSQSSGRRRRGHHHRFANDCGARSSALDLRQVRGAQCRAGAAGAGETVLRLGRPAGRQQASGGIVHGMPRTGQSTVRRPTPCVRRREMRGGGAEEAARLCVLLIPPVFCTPSTLRSSGRDSCRHRQLRACLWAARLCDLRSSSALLKTRHARRERSGTHAAPGTQARRRRRRRHPRLGTRRAAPAAAGQRRGAYLCGD